MWRDEARQMRQALGMLARAERSSGEMAEKLQEAAVLYINGHLEGPARLIRLGDEWRLISEPGTLLEALWVQLALSVLYARWPRRCPGCCEWFTPTRRDQQACSERCRWRVQKSRQRKNWTQA